MKYSKGILILISSLLCLFVRGEAYHVEQIDSRDGLSNSAVLAMYEDEDGFMWLGTYNGLNRYDGKFLSSFGLDDENNSIQSSDIINNIQGAGNKCLWLSTYIGFNKFSILENKVVEHYPNYRFPYNLASNNKNLTCLVAKKGYISVYNSAAKRFDDVRTININPTNVITTFIDKSDRLWIFTNDQHVWRATIRTGNKQSPQVDVEAAFLNKEPIISAFYESDSIYYVTVSGNLYTYDVSKKKNIYIKNISKLLKQYGQISSIVLYHNDFWISFKSSGLLKLIYSNAYNEEPVDLNTGVFCLKKDQHQDVLWSGSDGRGVYIFSKKTSIFNTIRSDQFPFVVRKPIRSIFTDSDHSLWIGTKGDGLIRIDDYEKQSGGKLDKDKIERFTTANGLSSNQIFSIVPSRYYNLNWLGTEGPGISYYSYIDRKVHSMNSNGAHVAIRKVHCLVEENDSVLWLATSGYGLMRVLHRNFEIKNVKDFIFERDHKTVNDLFSMYRDRNGFLWIASRGDGVIRFNPKNYTYMYVTSGKNFNSPTDDILSFCMANDHTFYMGSSSGLLKFGKIDNEYRLIPVVNKNRTGVKEMVHGLQEDKTGCLWMSTNRGLEKYNPKNNIFHKYLNNTGLDVIEFSDNADYTCPYTDRIFFGGIDGIVWIEQNIPESYIAKPKVNFTTIRINGVSENLEKYLKTDKRGSYLKLNYKQNSFSVGFVAIDYIRGNNIEYLYKLENYEKEWFNADDSNEAKFTSLPPGKYILKVKYKYDVFDEESAYYTLRIVVLPPWYLSVWAMFVYAILVATFVFCLLKYLKQRSLKKQFEFNKSVIEKNKEELYQTKMRFFANITHEFLTPLTLIQGACDRILDYDKIDKYIKRYASLLRLNSERLQSLIQEIIAFSKQEEFGLMECNIESVSINDVLKSIELSFSDIVERNKVQFKVEIAADVYWNTDLACLNKILMNLVSNAFKYTPAGGLIKVEACKEGNDLILKVSNTGKGIKPDEIQNVFDRFKILDNMEKNAYMDFSSRNGLGLAICYSMIQKLQGHVDVRSEENRLTEFIVSLPPLMLSAMNIVQSNGDEPGSLENENLPTANDYIPEENTTNAVQNLPKILVVDDNKEIVWMISDILQNQYEMIKAYNATEALAVLETETPELIVSDIMMPGEMDGSELVRKIKTNKFTSHIPVIVISAKNSMKDQISGIENGADFYLTKPFNLTYLKATVERLLDKKVELKEYYNSPLSAVELKSGQLIHQEDQIFLEKVKKIIDKNISQGELRSDYLAEQLGLSPQAFYRKLKAISSLSPTDFIKRYRFSMAAKLLLNSNLSVQEVIYKVGINNRSYFYREFDKFYNTTPKEYRALNNKMVDPDL